MKMNTYVNFAGKCAEAFRFYEKHLEGKVGMMMTHGQAPDQSKVSPEMKNAVLHARISVGGTELMGADIPSAQPMPVPICPWAWTRTPRRNASLRRCPTAAKSSCRSRRRSSPRGSVSCAIGSASTG